MSEQRISALEEELDALRNERARKAETEAQCAHLASTRAGITVEATDSDADIVAALCDEVENARKERDQHKQSAEMWRKRVEQAAEALADVLFGEVGRLDLLARIQALKDAVAAAQQMLARLKPSGQVAEDVALAKKYMHRVPVWQECHDAVDRLAEKAQGHEALLAVCAAVSKSVGFTGQAEQLPEAVESAMALGRKTLAEYQHAERERIAAVADNAALLESFELMKEAVETNDPGLVPLLCLSIMKRPHAGAALLEQHRKEVEALASRIAAMDREARAAKEALGAIWAVVGGMSDPASIAKSVSKKIAQARNEGLEKAAIAQDKEASDLRRIGANQPTKDARNAHEGEALKASERAARIRAMKEPEQ